MSEPEHFEILENHAVFRPTGEVSLEQVVQLAKAAVVFAREQHVRKLLVDMTGATGYASPSVTERYYIGKEWARAAESSIRVACVARPNVIDPQKFEVLVAKNVGAVGDIFESEEEALAWLLSRK
ncbi:MAG: hypothetical protein ABSG50_15250 [Opitutaceae bacterium]|jgi:hypothetical protein